MLSWHVYWFVWKLKSVEGEENFLCKEIAYFLCLEVVDILRCFLKVRCDVVRVMRKDGWRSWAWGFEIFHNVVFLLVHSIQLMHSF